MRRITRKIDVTFRFPVASSTSSRVLRGSQTLELELEVLAGALALLRPEAEGQIARYAPWVVAQQMMWSPPDAGR